jgi:hypothetical protein
VLRHEVAVLHRLVARVPPCGERRCCYQPIFGRFADPGAPDENEVLRWHFGRARYRPTGRVRLTQHRRLERRRPIQPPTAPPGHRLWRAHHRPPCVRPAEPIVRVACRTWRAGARRQAACRRQRNIPGPAPGRTVHPVRAASPGRSDSAPPSAQGPGGSPRCWRAAPRSGLGARTGQDEGVSSPDLAAEVIGEAAVGVRVPLRHGDLSVSPMRRAPRSSCLGDPAGRDGLYLCSPPRRSGRIGKAGINGRCIGSRAGRWRGPGPRAGRSQSR